MMIADVFIETSIKWNEVKDGIVGIAISTWEPENAKSFFGKVNKCSESAAVLYGLKNALRYLDQADEIVLNISCSYVAMVFTGGWTKTWLENGFLTKKGSEIKYRDLWEEITGMIKSRKVTVKYKEFNGYRNWLMAECSRRAQKYES